MQMHLDRVATIDEPVLIVFDDGDVLGISFDEGSSVRMELNTIPVTIEPGTNQKKLSCQSFVSGHHWQNNI